MFRNGLLVLLVSAFVAAGGCSVSGATFQSLAPRAAPPAPAADAPNPSAAPTAPLKNSSNRVYDVEGGNLSGTFVSRGGTGNFTTLGGNLDVTINSGGPVGKVSQTAITSNASLYWSTNSTWYASQGNAWGTSGTLTLQYQTLAQTNRWFGGVTAKGADFTLNGYVPWTPAPDAQGLVRATQARYTAGYEGSPEERPTALPGTAGGEVSGGFTSYDPDQKTVLVLNGPNSGPASSVFQFTQDGAGGMDTLVGNWGNDTLSTGLYDPGTGTWFLRNDLTTGGPDNTFVYGPASSSWMPLVGDWNGDGTDTVGLYNPIDGSFHLRNSNSIGADDLAWRRVLSPIFASVVYLFPMLEEPTKGFMQRHILYGQPLRQAARGSGLSMHQARLLRLATLMTARLVARFNPTWN